MIVSPDLPCDAGHGLTAGIWEQYLQDSTVRLGLLWGRDFGGTKTMGTSYHFSKKEECKCTYFLEVLKYHVSASPPPPQF
jgi:hypothetical protein